MNIHRMKEKAFTLIELLLVIGIIGILAVVFIINLNPSEAQRKARDLQRTKDGLTLQTFVEQWINDGQAIPASWSAAAGVTSSGISATSCSSGNWLGQNVCNYLKTVPIDPLNGSNRKCAGQAANCDYFYQMRVNGVDYEIRVRQESQGNLTRTKNDGGNDDAWVEFTNVSDGSVL